MVAEAFDAAEQRSETREFLERRFARDSAGGYKPHQPVGGLDGSGEPGQLLRLARTYRIIRWLEALKPESLLDLGAAEGYLANLVRLRIVCPVLCSDLSLEACRRAAEIYGLPGIAGDLTRLPLKPACADVVLLSEVFEHLPDPLAGLNAALRLARRYLVFSTQERCASRAEQTLRRGLVDYSEPHGERNWVTRGDLSALFPGRVRMEPEFRRTRRRLLGDVAPSEWGSHLRWLVTPESWRTAEGLIAVISVDGSPIPPLPMEEDDGLLELLCVGPPAAAGPDRSVFAWLDQLPAPEGFTAEATAAAISPPPDWHPLLSERRTAAFLRRVHAAPEAPAALRRMYAGLIPMMERLGYLSSSDPLPVKRKWLLRRPLA